jgi:hypothetical protein
MRIPLTVRFNFRKACFLAAGLLALAWFLIRVLPKPSRATYPCQRAAFPSPINAPAIAKSVPTTPGVEKINAMNSFSVINPPSFQELTSLTSD